MSTNNHDSTGPSPVSGPADSQPDKVPVPASRTVWDTTDPWVQSFRDRHQPQDGHEEYLVWQLAQYAWRLRFAQVALETLEAASGSSGPAGQTASVRESVQCEAHLRFLRDYADGQNPEEFYRRYGIGAHQRYRQGLKQLADYRRWRKSVLEEAPPERAILVENEPIPKSIALPVGPGDSDD